MIRMKRVRTANNEIDPDTVISCFRMGVSSLLWCCDKLGFAYCESDGLCASEAVEKLRGNYEVLWGAHESVEDNAGGRGWCR